MDIQAPFGFVTGCHAGDKFMVQATLASMRHYCPDVPICLVVDGDVDVSDLEKQYGLIILRILDLPNPEMRQLIGGNYRAKLAAMWEGPFEFYVWMDSDAIAWGDFIPHVRTDVDFQIFWSEISISTEALEVPAWLSHYYFDPHVLEKFDTGFQWRGHAYFSAGVYACRRRVISFEQWTAVDNWNNKVPGGLFKFGDMGILNYIVHSMNQQGIAQVVVTDLQHICEHHGTYELEGDCEKSGWNFPNLVARPRVCHFCGKKPWIFDRKAYSKPFTIARIEHYRSKYVLLMIWLIVVCQDFLILLRKLRNQSLKLRNKI